MIGVAVLGSNGSIGESTLDVLARHPDRFKLVAVHFHLGIVKKGFHFAALQPTGRFGRLAGPVHKLGVNAVQCPDAFRSLGAQPLAQRAFIGSLLQPHQGHQH